MEVAVHADVATNDSNLAIDGSDRWKSRQSTDVLAIHLAPTMHAVLTRCVRNYIVYVSVHSSQCLCFLPLASTLHQFSVPTFVHMHACTQERDPMRARI